MTRSSHQSIPSLRMRRPSSATMPRVITISTSDMAAAAGQSCWALIRSTMASANSNCFPPPSRARYDELADPEYEGEDGSHQHPRQGEGKDDLLEHLPRRRAEVCRRLRQRIRQLLEHGVDGQDGERQIHVQQPDAGRHRRVEQEGDGLADESEELETLVQRTIGPQENTPRVGPQDVAGPERHDDRQQHQGLEARHPLGNEVGKGIGEQHGADGCEEADSQAQQEMPCREAAP